MYADYYNFSYPGDFLFNAPEDEKWDYISGKDINDPNYPFYSGKTTFTKEEAERLGLITAEDVNEYGYKPDF